MAGRKEGWGGDGSAKKRKGAGDGGGGDGDNYSPPGSWSEWRGGGDRSLVEKLTAGVSKVPTSAFS